ncbi:uncharacterized protein LOC110025393 isoform X1 [Phalaenopsis equestris]|uniref:uncharacterized protein LOC110025393 isoform X1 n=1 Tax=Phalaenopsis equestris TaxID=78828 RepID=UPI0009E5D63B|nr:uncharacterized protein LOC110025393 isoform X1 [Phalaenopsis equestris]
MNLGMAMNTTNGARYGASFLPLYLPRGVKFTNRFQPIYLQLANDVELSPSVSQKQNLLLSREEVIKEKIILSQEKNIQRLNLLVQSLQQQLTQCRNINNSISFTENSLGTNANETEKQQILED